MSGWGAVVTIVGLMVVATIGFNASLWLRHQSLAAARGGWGDEDFAAAMASIGVTPDVTAALREVLSSYYMAGLAPRPDDDMADVLRITPDETEEVVERLFLTLGLPEPTAAAPESIPDLCTVEDLARYIQSRRDAFTPS